MRCHEDDPHTVMYEAPISTILDQRSLDARNAHSVQPAPHMRWGLPPPPAVRSQDSPGHARPDRAGGPRRGAGASSFVYPIARSL